MAKVTYIILLAAALICLVNGNEDGAFECTSLGTFTPADPCSSTVYMCLPSRNGYKLLNTTCAAGAVYDQHKGKCVTAPSLCRGVVDDDNFTCPTYGRFPSSTACNQYHVCYRVRWTFHHRLATCPGPLEYSSIKRKCVPRWYSDCGLQRYKTTGRSEIVIDVSGESSEESKEYFDEDKYKKFMKKMHKKGMVA
ncbi:uncharacterized protein [Anabrus simplex]|uniref:uncharacterized protein n=1 Tax=Anabrus simplex TaxID=316456 RepID=UPI0035A3377C